MFVDKKLTLSDSQALTVTVLSENIIDLGAAKNVATGKALYSITIIDVACATSVSIDFQLWTHSTTTVSSGTMMCSTGPIVAASLTANRAPIVLAVSDALRTAKQYLGMYYVVVTTGTCTVTTFIGFDAP